MHAHMEEHARSCAEVRGRVEILLARLGGKGVASWTEPQGRLLRQPRRPRRRRERVIELAAEAGSRYAGRRDVPPWQRSARPQHPNRADVPVASEIETAIDVLATCVLIAACEQALAQ